MKKVTFLLLIMAIVGIYASSTAQNTHKIEAFYSDTGVFKTDTVINRVLIEEEQFTIEVYRNIFNEHIYTYSASGDPYFEQSPITIIIKNSDSEIVYLKTFDFEPDDYPYLIYSFYKGQGQDLNKPGKLYVEINISYGGSGSLSNIYFITLKNGTISFNKLFQVSGVLDYVVYSSYDSEIIVLEGIWNFEEGETHFANHRYMITRYIFIDNSFQKKEIGMTVNKYSSLDEDKPIMETLKEIENREPELLQEINISDFSPK
ncbi:MAG: hypothetical protein KKA07_04415 [Bacteroidetes bacterium]|nr:hypothetical protein [Bacteroidota bacterium]MBU1718296.1 hypothetical protein [Bacteroidota bacterium]